MKKVLGLLPKKNNKTESKARQKTETAVVITAINSKPKKYGKLTPSHLSTKRKLKFVCISDTHTKLEVSEYVKSIPPGDVLLHTGDFTMDGTVREVVQFNEFLGILPHKHKILIAGNHEKCLESDRFQLKNTILDHYKHKYGVKRIRDLLTNCVYLEDEMVEIEGIKIYGTPWVQFYSSCSAFSLSDNLHEKWDLIPDDVDILMTHGPPRGYGDLTHRDVRAGSSSLTETVLHRVKPKYHVFGHIHEGYGIYEDEGITFINSSICTRGYKPTNQPITFEMDMPQLTNEDSVQANPITVEVDVPKLTKGNILNTLPITSQTINRGLTNGNTFTTHPLKFEIDSSRLTNENSSMNCLTKFENKNLQATNQKAPSLM